MKNTSALGYSLAGAVLTTGLLFFGFFAWLYLFPAQADRLGMGIIGVFLYLPLMGFGIGAAVGSYLWNDGSPRSLFGERHPIVFRPRSGSAVDPSRHATSDVLEDGARVGPEAPLAATDSARTGVSEAPIPPFSHSSIPSGCEVNSDARKSDNGGSVRRSPEPASFMDGVMFLVVALVPGVWSVLIAVTSWEGPWLRSVGHLLQNVLFLVPCVVAVALVVCGVSVIRQSRES